MAPRPIALLTDFGLDDWYVGALKGEILRRLPEARIIDISHSIPPQQVPAAAFVLAAALPSMPEDTVFCCVVDPGVGGARRALCGRIGTWMFSGPDNGLLTRLFSAAGGDIDLHLIESDGFRNPTVSPTFHGRDLFAPAAARLAAGGSPAAAGPAVSHPVLLTNPQPHNSGASFVATVVWIDRFGNLITNLDRAIHGKRLEARPFEIRAGKLKATFFGATFSEVSSGEALAYWGSAGTLEIAVNRGSAAKRSGLGVGGGVEVN